MEAELKAAGVFAFTGGLADAAPVFSVDASSGTPLFTDGPFVEPPHDGLIADEQ